MEMKFDEICKRIMRGETVCAPGSVKRRIEATEANVEARAVEMLRSGYEPTEASVKAIEAYLSGYGLWLHGKVGTGKTAFFRHLKPMRFGESELRPSRIVVWSMLTTLGADMDEIRGKLRECENDELVLDDVGSEPVFNFYGGKFEILPYVIERRMESSRRTHVTTNLTAKEIAARYGVRTLDRFAEMFAPIEFTGASRRTLKQNDYIVEVHARFMAERSRMIEVAKEAEASGN